MKGWFEESQRHSLAARGIRTNNRVGVKRPGLSEWKDYIRRMDTAWRVNGYNLSGMYLEDEEGQRRWCREMGFAANDFENFEISDIWNHLVKHCIIWNKKILIDAKDCYKEARSNIRE